MEYFTDLSLLDIILLLVLAYGLVKGLLNGLIMELASLLALILGVYAAFHFSDLVELQLIKQFKWEHTYTGSVAFVLTFIAVLLAVVWVGKALTALVTVILMGWLNRLAGAVFGLLKVALILSVILSFLLPFNAQLHWIDAQTIASSKVIAPLCSLGEIVFPAVQEFLGFQSL